MVKTKHKPQRTCIVCREIKEKRDLIRIVRIPEGKVIVDPTGKANGRGAYLCRNAECINKGVQKGRVTRALKVTLSADELALLQTELLKA